MRQQRALAMTSSWSSVNWTSVFPLPPVIVRASLSRIRYVRNCACTRKMRTTQEKGQDYCKKRRVYLVRFKGESIIAGFGSFQGNLSKLLKIIKASGQSFGKFLWQQSVELIHPRTHSEDMNYLNLAKPQRYP